MSDEHIMPAARKRGTLWGALLLSAAALALNLGLKALSGALGLPLYLDSVGTVLAAALGGYLPGIAVGYLTNLLLGLRDGISMYYSVINVFLAVAAVWLSEQGYFRKIGGLLLSIGCFAVIGGGIGSMLTWLLYGFGFGEDAVGLLAQSFYSSGVGEPFLCQLCAGLLIDLVDKALVVLICAVTLRLLPQRVCLRCRPYGWRQAPLSEEQRREIVRHDTRRISLRVKIVLILAVITLLVAASAIAINWVQYHKSILDYHKQLGVSISRLAAGTIDPERVDDYLAEGEAAEGYAYTEQRLDSILRSSPQIEYLYVYRILPDGCHVVFDLDTPELEGADPGTLIDFDESFADYIPILLRGGTIEPLIANDTYGWLLTAYEPIYDAEGNCVCYAAADISMGQVTQEEITYLTRAVSLFFGIFFLILALGLWMAEYSVVLPINSMALTAGTFAYDNEKARSESVEHIAALDIHTGDEIENLYKALAKTTEDTIQYIRDVQEKNETISHMQHGLILVLADMVESRDQCTGDHVRKTAAYVKIIVEQMKREGIYDDALTEAFMQDVVDAAPLHDVGKIEISDLLLNKPGKLTDEEFQKMKEHTTAGGEVISHAIALVTDTGYLEEAKNLATYHHERWDGKGYPTGLAGEDIPLGARIMAVADVFDALVSRRSYKKPFSFEQAVDIIRSESGTHFDPQVVRAFLDALPEVRRTSELNMEV
ncbi:MAG: HD domain-containing protein [Oscillospiraceae bacterium]|nr:HD domain-containing protein [Oscillospiraceae bacterium]